MRDVQPAHQLGAGWRSVCWWRFKRLLRIRGASADGPGSVRTRHRVRLTRGAKMKADIASASSRESTPPTHRFVAHRAGRGQRRLAAALRFARPRPRRTGAAPGTTQRHFDSFEGPGDEELMQSFPRVRGPGSRSFSVPGHRTVAWFFAQDSALVPMLVGLAVNCPYYWLS